MAYHNQIAETSDKDKILKELRREGEINRFHTNEYRNKNFYHQKIFIKKTGITLNALKKKVNLTESLLPGNLYYKQTNKS